MGERMMGAAVAVFCAVAVLGCEEPPKEETPTKPSAAPAATPAPTPEPKPEVKKPSHECPENSKGDGTFEKPCKATGTERILEVTWNNKIGDKGPTFKVVSQSDLEILYGRIVVYFYDKAGKQLELEGDGKKKSYLTCGGNIFAGAIKPKEKIFVNFSCVKKDDVPEGATAIEAEARVVGFTAKDGGKPDTYWSNEDLVPKKRPKGGIKKK